MTLGVVVNPTLLDLHGQAYIMVSPVGSPGLYIERLASWVRPMLVGVPPTLTVRVHLIEDISMNALSSVVSSAVDTAVSSVNFDAATMAANLMLVNVSFTGWDASLTDKSTAREVEANKGASGKACSVRKYLLGDTKELTAIRSHQGSIGAWFRSQSASWLEGSYRAVPIRTYERILERLAEFKEERAVLVENLISVYSTAIQKQAFAMGALFDRNDYPSEDELRARFTMTVSTIPFRADPNDFRCALPQAQLDKIKNDYKAQITGAVEMAMREAWDQLYATIKTLATQLRVKGLDGADKTGRVHESTLQALFDTLDVMDGLNLTSDPAMTERLRELRKIINGQDVETLRKDEATRIAVKQDLDALLSKFDY